MRLVLGPEKMSSFRFSKLFHKRWPKRFFFSVFFSDGKVYRAVYKGEENVSFASTLHNLGMAFRAMADEAKKLERIPLLERAAEAFERCVQIREKVRGRKESPHHIYTGTRGNRCPQEEGKWTEVIFVMHAFHLFRRWRKVTSTDATRR